MKKLLKILLILILVIVAALAALLGWLTATEFDPAPVEAAAITRAGDNDTLHGGDHLTVLSWNIGFGGLGKAEDSFLDGGTKAKPDSRDVVYSYLDGIAKTIAENEPDLVLLQEVDVDSARTYGIDERGCLDSGMSCDTFALNYSCPFVPVPVPPMGKVNSGLFTMTDDLLIERAERISLPCPFSWPLRIANLKRCMLVSYLPIAGSDSKLVLVNFHLEAYSEDEGKLAQMKQISDFIADEYAKGNYVVAGGDFNMAFPGSLAAYPNTHKENWDPGEFDNSLLPEGFGLAYDLRVPSCRLLNQPYDPGDEAGTQHYVIDGLILSPNVTALSVETLDLGFVDSDHNPVRLELVLDSAA